ncbi:pseudouridine synthase [uncultured Clostridium sp.]|uniref:pseudouridine synthase n=1 Tax=uncultured Clostridium sp. TaxID=59620 RepID=UPI00261B5E3C|nr:pseudouridine synthase [uncultured Clostridium sp.]
MRINKLLSNFGYCSRSETRNLIEDGRIIVNGENAIQGQWVEIDEDIILVDNKIIVMKDRVYIVFNKPVGVTCTAEKSKKDNIIDYIGYKQYIFPIGRLDKDSQGLILLTNDGDLANDILEAENGHEKEYIVGVNKIITSEFINGMSSGVQIGDKITKRCKVIKIDDLSFKIILTQGLNRQIRKMCLNFGYKVQKLERIRILNINLGNLKCGEYREISLEELNLLRDKLKM